MVHKTKRRFRAFHGHDYLARAEHWALGLAEKGYDHITFVDHSHKEAFVLKMGIKKGLKAEARREHLEKVHVKDLKKMLKKAKAD